MKLVSKILLVIFVANFFAPLNGAVLASDEQQESNGNIIVQAEIRPGKNEDSKAISLCDSGEGKVSILSIDAAGNLLDSSGAPIMRLSEGRTYNIAAAIDIEKNQYSVYIDAKRRAYGLSLNDMNGTSDPLRVCVTNTNTPSATQFFLNEMKVYEGNTPNFDDEVEEIDWELTTDGLSTAVNSRTIEIKMKDTLAFYIGAHYALVNGVRTRIDESSKDVTPFLSGDSALVPARFITENLGGKITYDLSTQTASISLCGKDIKATVGEPNITVDGVSTPVGTPAQVVYDRLFLPLRAMGELAGKKVLWDRCGLIVLSDRDELFNWRDDQTLMSAVAGEMIYERPSGTEMIKTLIEKNPDNKHPRLLATEETFEKMRQEIADGKTKAQWFKSIKTDAETIVARPIIQFGRTDGIRMRDQSSRLAKMVLYCGFVYNLTGEERFAERAWKEIESLCNFPNWNPYHFLDIGQFMMGMAVGYDWLYHYLNEDQRKLMRESILEKAYVELRKDYFDLDRERTYKWSLNDQPDNWNCVINSGAIMSSLAMGDEEPEICAAILHEAVPSIEGPLNMFAPDGAWDEGTDYWGLSIETLVEAISSLETALGDNYGLLKAPGVAVTGYFPYAMMGPVGTFNVADSDTKILNPSEPLYLAQKVEDENLKMLRVNQIMETATVPLYRDFLYCDGEPEPGESHMDLDWYYRVAEVMTTRNSWQNDKALFAGFHAGKNYINHSHLDMGSFIIDSYGDRFALDLGCEEYNLQGGFYKYRQRAQGHNTLLINPNMDYYDQNFYAYAYMNKYESNEVSCYAITDMSCGYVPNVDSAVRGLKMTNGRTTILVQDEVKSSKPAEIYWHMHTTADVEISPDGKSAILDINGNKMMAKILTPDGTFYTTPAQPLPNTPNVNGQYQNEGVQRLTIHYENVTELTLAVAFRPFVFEKIAGDYPEVVPLEKWTLDDPEKSPAVTIELPELSDLEIDGESVENFSPDRVEYKLNLESMAAPMPKISVQSEHKTEIIYPASWPDDIVINVDDGMFQNRYVVRVAVGTKSEIGTEYEEITIEKADAMDIPQPENPPTGSFDNDFNTRFSGETPTWIMYDLGEEQPVDYVGLAFFGGAARKAIIDVEISTDRKNWTKVFSGETSGVTEQLEYIGVGGGIARYVRVSGFGTSTGENWLSITEFKAFREKK